MKCQETSYLSNVDYLLNFSNRAYQERIPLSGSIDITSRCNFKCIHCYYGSYNEDERKELSTDRWLSIIDEITEAGCLFLLISGGEPILRKDFSVIYRHAKMNGILPTVFSNGTLITEEIATLFSEFPPQVVEITIYGATSETSDRITKIKGSLEKCLKGIETLLLYNVNVKLKTILMTENAREFNAIENIARDFGVPFRFDAAIFPRFNGDRSPLKLRVQPEFAVSKEFSDPLMLKKYREYFEQTKDFPVVDTLYICSAGYTNFHIDPHGNLKPCLMTNNFSYNIEKDTFMNGWINTISDIIRTKAPEGYKCNKCEKRTLCGFCPAFFLLENGNEQSRSEYLCKMGEERYRFIINNNGGYNEIPRQTTKATL